MADPIVVTLPASNITMSSGWMSGEITDMGSVSPLETYINWGLAPAAPGGHANWIETGDLTEPGGFSALLQYLAPGTTIYYQANAYSVEPYIDIYGEDLSFTTKVSSPGHGVITPLGNTLVEGGENKIYYMIPDEDYRVEAVVVDDRVVAGPYEYDQPVHYHFNNVRANHKIQCSCTQNIQPIAEQILRPNSDTWKSGLWQYFPDNPVDIFSKVQEVIADDDVSYAEIKNGGYQSFYCGVTPLATPWPDISRNNVVRVFQRCKRVSGAGNPKVYPIITLGPGSWGLSYSVVGENVAVWGNDYIDFFEDFTLCPGVSYVGVEDLGDHPWTSEEINAITGIGAGCQSNFDKIRWTQLYLTINGETRI